MNDDKITTALIAGILLGILLFGFFLVIAGTTYVDGKEAIQKEAVKNGAAHWEVTTDGKPVFKWNKVPNETL